MSLSFLKLRYKFSSLQVKFCMFALCSAFSSFACSKAALPICVNSIRSAFFLSIVWLWLYPSILSFFPGDSNVSDKTSFQLKDFYGLRSFQLFSLTFSSDASLHCPLVKPSNSCIHAFSHTAYHWLEKLRLSQNFLFLSVFTSSFALPTNANTVLKWDHFPRCALVLGH